MSYRGKHRKPSTIRRNIARVAATGMAMGAPLAIAAAPANAAGYNPNWDMLAQCESSGDWSINTGNGYYGGLQFSPSTWQAYGGQGMPHQASRAEQIRIAEKVLAAQGPGAWPACSAKTGWYNAGGSGQSYQGTNTEGGGAQEQKQQQAKPAQPAPKAAPVRARVTKSNPNGDYTVRKGDTLSEIAAEKNIKGGWKKLHQLNKEYISDPDLILVGQKIATK
ncbi:MULTISPECIES: transglycosylase family protein [Thermocrispum]|jgi:LysM repeat protein|uniref:LysM peptidoglycan-binding domain-containing protein n=1 Tax=Thermocrispum agreste TaxID=37925 RepID=A0A2W4JMA9_9PSEU|nr:MULTISPECIES: transglycosylase family protein [Thermocrispum]PZN00261.1 MAG: LysM peptidoglycan-binding domain-containing protein [Thermocrispum agreste]